MRRLFAVVFAASFLLFQLSCQSEADKQAERNAVIDSTLVNFQKKLYTSYIDSVFAKEDFNGSVLVFQNGQQLYEKENGFEDFNKKTKLDSLSVFAIGSLSKQFTAVVVLLQNEAGKLKLGDKVSQYLPEFQNEEYKAITIHQLLNHTSGLNDFGATLLSKPGTEFNYSNKGYRFLGKLAEKVSGKTYDELVNELFVKAEMKHSSTGDVFEGGDFAGAYIGGANNVQKVEGMPERLADKDIGIPAGGILSTLNDLERWNEALYNGKILKPESLESFKKQSAKRSHPILGEVGYGYGIMMNLGKPEAYFHTGYVKGSPSLNIYYPKTKTSVVILSNIAEESKGLSAIFIPHMKIKQTADVIESSVESLKSEMQKPIED